MSVLSVVGAAAGFFIGGPKGALIGFSLGTSVDTVVNAPDRVGPRLEDLRIQMSQYGATIPFEWGTNRHSGTIMWPRRLEAVEHRHEESSKGGGPDNVSYRYSLSCAVLVCEGPIAGIRRIWANKRIVYDQSTEYTDWLNRQPDRNEEFPQYYEERETIDPSIRGIRFYLGTEDQALDPLIEATDGPGPAYRGYAYVVFEDYDVTELNGRPPQWEFEVITVSDTEIEPATTFGEEYQLGNTGRRTFSADIDTNGHLWLNTMDGHAWINPTTGKLEVSADGPGVPQIHEYDAITGELLWFFNVPAISEQWDADGPPQEIYPIQGKSVCSGGYYFVGRGYPGWPAVSENTPSYAHGIAVNIQTHAVELLYNTCSSGQFQNAFYWPSVPVPAIDNNGVYFASGNGLETALGVGFMPASIPETATTPEYDPAPHRSGGEVTWNVPAGWAQKRAKAPCPVKTKDGPPPEFDGVAIKLPNVAHKSTVIHNPEGVIVQGPGSNGTYLALVTNPVPVTAFDTTRPDVATCMIPGNVSIMPPIAWDPINQVVWAFGGDDRDQLYAITHGSSTDPLNTGGLTATFTNFTLPKVEGAFKAHTAHGVTIDKATGLLRVVRGYGGSAQISLVDPMAGAIVSDTPINAPVGSDTGKMWDVPSGNVAIFADGYRLMRVPYGAPLAPHGVPLSQIVADICTRAGLSGSDIDVSELTDPVDGYIVPRQMTARAAIEPLQQAFFFDAVESDDKIKFVKRGKSGVTVIPVEDRAAHEHGQEVPDGLTITRAFELELPVQCDVEYPDIEADHLIGNQSDRRITKDTRHNLNLQIPVVMKAEKAKQVARTLLYDAWQNQVFKFSTSRKYAHLEPTSLIELPTAAAMYRGRITGKREQPNGVIEWEAKVDSVEVYTQTGEGAVPVGHVPQAIFKPSTTYLEMLDIPLLRDQDEDAGFYVAMGGV